MPSKKILDAIKAQLQGHEDTYVDRYRNSADVNDLWFGGFDLGSKHDYGKDYLSQEQRDAWAGLTPEQREPLLRATFQSALKDDDRSFGQELVHKGVPLAVGAALGYGAFTGLAGLAGAGGGGGTLGAAAGKGGVDLGTLISQGVDPSIVAGGAGGGGAGFWGKLGGAFKNANGTLNWDKIAKVGGLAAGVLGGATAQDPVAGPGAPPVDNTPLQQLTYGRQRNSGPSDYFTYGRGPQAQEHRFFTDATFTPANGPQAQPGGTPNAEPVGYAPNQQIDQQALLSSLVRKAHGGTPHVRGPGSGRDDKIEALLSADEYVMDAETVAMLGDGSPEEGARRLDEMRANIRKHKGQALAKGKFSPNAKAPEQYIGKSRGGSIKRVITGGLPKPTIDEKKARLEAIRRFEAAFRAAKRDREPVRKAKGGRVDNAGAIKNLVRLANQLQHSLQSGNGERVHAIANELDGMRKGAGDEGIRAFARGGSVTAALKKLFSAAPPVERPPTIRHDPDLMNDVARELARLKPDSEALRMYNAAKRRPVIDTRRSRAKENQR